MHLDGLPPSSLELSPRHLLIATLSFSVKAFEGFGMQCRFLAQVT